jgi:phosphoribosylaminoimidazole (AIR) synthetase
MFRSFNMGIGFALVVGAETAEIVRARLSRGDFAVHVLGRAIEDCDRTLHLRPQGLVGRSGRFAPAREPR